MKLKIVAHDAEEDGLWAEVPAVPECVTRGDAFEDLLGSLYEAVEGCLSVGVSEAAASEASRVIETAV